MKRLLKVKMISEELSGFTGSDGYHKGFCGVLMTDGVWYLYSKAGWVVSDASVICKMHKKVKSEAFVSVTTEVKGGKAVTTYDDGNGNVLYKQSYAYTDLEDGEVLKMYYVEGVLMLRGEY